MRIHFTTLAVILLVACANTGASDILLERSKWRFTAIDGKAPAAKGAKLDFEGDRLGAWVGCNTFGGLFALRDGKILAPEMVGTAMYCDAMMEQEKAVSELLAGGPSFVVSGDRLTLKSARHSAELVQAN